MLLAAAPLVAAGAWVGAGALSGHASPAPGNAETASAPASGGSAERLRSEAEDLRAAKRYDAARDAYQKLVQVTPGDADAWADLADAQGAAAGGDLAAGSAAIDHALAINPQHLKALWLKASLEYQQQRYDSAARLWEQLLAQLPPDSSDARIVRANLDESRALAAKTGAAR
ncbi:MAG: hypothetical protein JSR54_04265 [Proteobacteria bacterium]|nr:hypothetical protein [Pseudomonadota bacterium]